MLRIGLSAAAAAMLAGCSAPPRDAAMVSIPAGPATQIGDDHAPRDERPQFALDIAAFKLDRTPVTVAQFRAFVTATHYTTEAEKLGSAGVLSKGMGGWIELDGAAWDHPLGPSEPPAEDTHPVTQVSWNDAVAFCKTYGLRLPTEFEWERAARLGQTPDGIVYDASTPAGLIAKVRGNTWQGIFPITDTGDDGFTGTSPVGAFGEAPSGLTDMAGNVWEWTSSSYTPYPATLNDPRTAPERVQRGGSFLCSTGGCEGFRATARSHSTPETSLMHVGFRCAG